MKLHLIDHRIYQAIGGEKAWVKEYSDRQTIGKQKRIIALKDNGRLVHLMKTRERAEWLWQRTILKVSKAQRARLGWIIFQGWGPVLLLPSFIQRWDQSARWPLTIKRQIEYCREIAASIEADAKQIVLNGLLSPEERQNINAQFVKCEEFDKAVLYAPGIVRFVVYRSVTE